LSEMEGWLTGQGPKGPKIGRHRRDRGPKEIVEASLCVGISDTVEIGGIPLPPLHIGEPRAREDESGQTVRALMLLLNGCRLHCVVLS
jgi:hypothetical protein